jgi:hypothetical protein
MSVEKTLETILAAWIVGCVTYLISIALRSGHDGVILLSTVGSLIGLAGGIKGRDLIKLFRKPDECDTCTTG